MKMFLTHTQNLVLFFPFSLYCLSAQHLILILANILQFRAFAQQSTYPKLVSKQGCRYNRPPQDCPTLFLCTPIIVHPTFVPTNYSGHQLQGTLHHQTTSTIVFLYLTTIYRKKYYCPLILYQCHFSEVYNINILWQEPLTVFLAQMLTQVKVASWPMANLQL